MLFREPCEKLARQRRDVGSRQTLKEGLHRRRPLGGDEAELGPMTADRIYQLRALAHQPIALARKHQGCLLIGRFRRHEAHMRPTYSLAQRRRIGRIVLAARHVRLGKLWRDQPHLVPKPRQLAGPMMRRPARFHRHHRRRQPLEEGQRLGARQLAPQRHLFVRIDAMKLKETLGRVHANARNLFHGRLLF